jgi:hypothetical protein
MDARTVALYLDRAAAATSVRELHATVRALHRAHPADPDADRVERACWERALGLLTRPAPPAARPAGARLEGAGGAHAGPRAVHGARVRVSR